MASTPKPVPARKHYHHWSQVPAENWRWPNFSPEEIASNKFVSGNSGPVEKDSILVDARAMDMLQALRTRLKKPLIVNSAYRSPEYNKQIKGASASQHPQGTAFDISMANHNPSDFEQAAVAVGFRGIGHYPGDNFMHIDARQQERVSRWTGTGKNAKWFPEGPGSFSGSDPVVEKPATVSNSLLKPDVLIPLAGAAGTAGLGEVAGGNGPVAWAIGFAVIVLVLISAGVWLRKYRNPSIE